MHRIALQFSGGRDIAGRGSVLHKLIPVLCAILCVAVSASMMTHGVSDVRHQASHATGEQAHGIGHDHSEAEAVAPDIEVASMEEPESSGSLPPGHHHHGGGDAQAAPPSQQNGLSDTVRARAPSIALRVSQLPEGLISDGPEHPPKQLRLIA